MASGIYHRLFANLMNKEIDLEGDTINVALMDNVHAFNGANEVWADVSANEVSGSGYVAGGGSLSNKAVTQGSITKWDADNISWLNATFSAYHAVIFDDTLVGKDLLCSIDFGGEQAVSDGTFEIQFDVAGIITLTEA